MKDFQQRLLIQTTFGTIFREAADKAEAENLVNILAMAYGGWGELRLCRVIHGTTVIADYPATGDFHRESPFTA